MKKRYEQSEAKKERKCYKWHHKEHICRKEESKEVFAVSENNDERAEIVDKANTLISEAFSNIDSMMEEMNYECKYTNEKKKKKRN